MLGSIKRFVASPVGFCATVFILQIVLIIVVHYPYDSDRGVARSGRRSTQNQYYDEVYSDKNGGAQSGPDDLYVRIAQNAAEEYGVKGKVSEFAKRYRLQDKKVLDVGAGRGYLQDIVDDYTGLDISASARRYFHKRFVRASATDMPFENATFDAAWTIWVLEHIPNPEQALIEMRRVLKDGGLLYLAPAWRCTTWAAEGYEVRLYSELDAKGKLVKASLPIQKSPLFQIAYIYPIRATRLLEHKLRGENTPLRYTKLNPNYEKYWVPDSDAVNSIDKYEALLWFKARGDECLNCKTEWKRYETGGLDPLIIRIRKRGR